MAKARVSFQISHTDSLLVGKVARRAARASAKVGFRLDVIEIRMDLAACHANGNPVDFAKLLAADDATFGHDVFGISRHMDRDTGQLRDFFSPRCSLPQAVAA